jgi:hypothetical protein
MAWLDLTWHLFSPEGVAMIAIKGDTLANMINKTIYAITAEEAGFKLSGVLTEKVVVDDINFLRMVVPLKLVLRIKTAWPKREMRY